MTTTTTTAALVRSAARAGAVLLVAAAGLFATSPPAGAAGTATMVVSATQPAPGITPGQTGSSTISVSDVGTAAKLTTKVTVTLPATVAGQPTVVLTPAAGVSCLARKLTPLAHVCTVGRILAGGSATVATLTATAPSDTGSGLSTAVTVTGPTNSTSVTFQWAASLPALTTAVSLSPTAIELGQWITGTLTVANTGFGTAGSFLTYVPLPSPYDPDALVSQTPGTSCIPYEGNLQCLMPGLAPGGTITVVWSFQPQAGPTAQVTATADVQGTLVQSTRAGDVATSNAVPVSGTGAVLTVASTNAATTPQGSNFTRTVTVTNSGDTPALNTVVQDWSGWFNFLGTVSGGTCAQFTVGVGGKGGSHPVQAGTQCSIGTVPAGGSVAVTFTLESAPNQAVTTYTNKVVVTDTTPGGSSTPGTSVIAVVVPSSPVAPALLSAPGAPSGNVVVGDTLATGNGSWNGTPTIGFTYQWLDCAGATCTPIPSATGATYTVQGSDVGSTIECTVTATNGGGSASVTTPPTVAAIAAVAPTVVSPPTVSSAEPAVGVTYYGSTGTWSGTPDITYTFQWYGCDSSGTVCTPIAGATGSTYVLTAVDIGVFLQVQVTATNTGGSTTAASNLATTSG